MPASSSPYQRFRAFTASTMSSTSDPSSPANSGYQERATQPPQVPASRPQSEVVLRVQSVLTTGQSTGGQSDLCQHFAEICTSTYGWMPISTTEMHRLSALNVPSQITLNEGPLIVPPFNSSEPEQKCVSRLKKNSSSVGNLQTYLELTVMPHNQAIEGRGISHECLSQKRADMRTAQGATASFWVDLIAETHACLQMIR